MPRFEPFGGLRYDLESGPLSELIAPPYDVVDETQREQLVARSPYNSIRVELPVDDSERGLGRYASAAALIEEWEQEGVLRQDDVPSLYVYRMRFVLEDGRERHTTGVIGSLGLDPSGGDVLPHERTTPKPKGDRLELLRATRVNLSPIWGLSLSRGLAEACAEATAGLPAPASATDGEGVVHELWPVSDPDAVARLSAHAASAPIVIADGHHRYETACFYQTERRAANGGAPGAYDLVMALVVELTEDELSVQPIHRLVRGLPEGIDVSLLLERYFEVLAGPDDSGRLPEAMVGRGALGLVTPKGSYLLVPSPEVEQAAEADLDSSRLDVALASFPAHDLVYQHGVRQSVRAVEEGQAQAAFLLRPATVAQIAETAHNGRRMPPKTTFFHPKPRTGMVFRPVAG